MLRATAFVAAVLASAAVVALVARGFLLARRVERLADQISQVVEEDAKRAIAEVQAAAQGVRRTADRADHALAPLSSTAQRLDRWTAALAAEAFVASAVTPAVAKIGSWLAGLRRTLGEAVHHREGADRG